MLSRSVSEDAWIAELERRSEGRGPLPTGFIPLSAGVRPAIG
jgi:hypothetical protein